MYVSCVVPTMTMILEKKAKMKRQEGVYTLTTYHITFTLTFAGDFFFLFFFSPLPFAQLLIFFIFIFILFDAVVTAFSTFLRKQKQKAPTRL